MTNVVYVDPKTLQPHPQRGLFKTVPTEEDGAYLRIRESIEERGIEQPVKVQQATGRIIAGHTRVEVAITLGIEVPVVYLDVDDETALNMMVRDNWERAVDEPDLIKRARVLRSYQESQGFGHGGNRTSGTGNHLQPVEDIAQLFSMGERQFRKYVKLLDLVEPLQAIVSRGMMGVKAGALLATLEVWRQEAFYASIQSSLSQPGFTVSEALARSYRENCLPTQVEESEDAKWTDVFVANNDQQSSLAVEDEPVEETSTTLDALVSQKTLVIPLKDDAGVHEMRLNQIDEQYQLSSQLTPNPLDRDRKRQVALTAQAFNGPQERTSFYRRAARMRLEQVEKILLREECELVSVLTHPSVTEEEDIEGQLERIKLILQRFQDKLIALQPVPAD